MSSVWLNPSVANAASMASASTSALDRVTKQAAPVPAVEADQNASSYWSISTTMRPGSLSSGTVQEANEIAAAVTDTAALGLEQATDIVARMQQKLVLSKAVGADRNAINADIMQMKSELVAVVGESSFNGDNWLQVEAGGRLVTQAGATMQDVVASVQRVTDIMAEISAASSEQSAGVGQIT
ncbi:MAG: hypothetical protein ACOVOA_03890, partial [Allorhizobium sp.]